MMLAALALAATCAMAAHPAHTARDSSYWDGPPPERFRSEQTLSVTTVARGGISAVCDLSGPPPCPLQTLACTVDGHVYLPNPCDEQFKGERFAAEACHEFAHRQGWPRTHGQ